MTLNYPPGVTELPDDKVEEQEYIFEVHGEITVFAYNKDDARYQIMNETRDIVAEAIRNGDIEIQ